MQTFYCSNERCPKKSIPVKVETPEGVDMYEFEANYPPHCSCGAICIVPFIGEQQP
jgi:hypothetical protein